MGIDTNRLVEIVDQISILTTELTDLMSVQELPSAEQIRLSEVIQTLDSILESDALR